MEGKVKSFKLNSKALCRIYSTNRVLGLQPINTYKHFKDLNVEFQIKCINSDYNNIANLLAISLLIYRLKDS